MTKKEYILCAAIKRLKPIEVKSYNYQTGKTSKYIFATLADSDLVKAEDRLNGYRVETVKNVYIDGEFIVCEVTAV